ncbi:unnamed protein product [Nyctereutes procyonoides]|uniref:(raccoon dog) hypothetical protein n=1 Tax=Nyctereutes procyonoides TaxID=34880 RepID=A0A811YHT7_NYCPR|nr:unnamed protein product [Nyctereutes procyonoides]
MIVPVTGTTPMTGRFTPGTFTNQMRTAFQEPRLLEVSYVDLPTTPMVEQLICCMWTLLSFLYMCGTMSHEHLEEVMPDFFFCRDPK